MQRDATLNTGSGSGSGAGVGTAGPIADTAAPAPLDPRVVGLFFGGGALLAVALAIAAWWTPAALTASQRGVLAALGLAQTLAFGIGALIALRGRVALAALLGCASAQLALIAAGLVALPDMSLRLVGLMGYLVCVGAVFAGRRAALALAVLAVAGVAGVVWARPGQAPTAIVLVLAQIAAGLLIGVTSSLALTRLVAALRQREDRFRRLTRIAVDGYFELDEQLRFKRKSGSAVEDAMVFALGPHVGRAPWEVPHTEPAPADWAAHRADLEAHRPVRDFVVRPPDADGAPRYASVSCEPVFDDAGRFTGYWGVVRFVTPEVLARQAVQATAQRYRQLFERSPSPMIAHRRAEVIHANAAAARLLGYADAGALAGADLHGHHAPVEALPAVVDGQPALDALPDGDSLPMADLQVKRLDGALLDLQATSLRVQLDDGPATLTIYVDVTARRAAEEALRHSQTLLERLFDTTPDAVSLTEARSGRHVMVNDRFTQVLGWPRAEVIGRDTLELGLYAEPRVRAALRRKLLRTGALRDEPVVWRGKTGQPVTLRLSAAFLNFDGTDYVVAVHRDVSASEQSRLEREAILNNASIGIGFTRDRRFVLANPYFERIFGWPPRSLTGQPDAVVWPSADEHAAMEQIAMPLLAAGQPFESERTMSRRDGGLFWCRLSARAVDPGDPSRGGTIWIVEDITERRQVEHSLAAARDAAEAASRAKSAFLANTSHEIRTPLNGLLGLARLAQQPDVDPALRERYVAQIFDSAQALSGIISDILDLSKIEAGKLTLETVAFDVRALLNGLCDSYDALAVARGLRLERRIDPMLPARVRGDPVRVRQIVSNFIANALKFTERGSVSVEVSRGLGELLHFVVGDTGQGIDAATQARLFRPFVQADDSTTRRYGGTGLGLSICRELATLMGGAVGVDSKPRRGSRFWADLPLPSVGADDADDAHASGFDELIAGARVLVVEDNAVNLLIVRALLESWGMQVVEAGDGQQALDAVERATRAGETFDAVLMDLQMPVMSGYEAASRLRQRADGAQLAIVALTAAALVSERDRALAAGMDAFLTKPIDPLQLRATLARVRGSRART